MNALISAVYILFFRYEYDDPRFEMVHHFTNNFISGDGPISPINFFPGWIARLISTKV